MIGQKKKNGEKSASAFRTNEIMTDQTDEVEEEGIFMKVSCLLWGEQKEFIKFLQKRVVILPKYAEQIKLRLKNSEMAFFFYKKGPDTPKTRQNEIKRDKNSGIFFFPKKKSLKVRTGKSK